MVEKSATWDIEKDGRIFMNRALRNISLVYILLISFFFSNFSYADDSWRVHESAWRALLNNKSTDSKFAFYAGRLINVMHPELYLMADLEMFEEINALHPDILFRFNWAGLKKIETITERRNYTKEAPFYDYLDRRIMPPTSSLLMQWQGETLVKKKMTSLEKAVLAYYVRSQSGESADSAILYCSNSDAYLILGERAFYMKTMEQYALQDISCQPLLIFNKADSWSVITKKKPKLPSLKKIVERVANRRLDLSQIDKKEREYLRLLARKTALTKDEKKIAALFAEKRGPIISIEYENALDMKQLGKWQNAFAYDKIHEKTIDRVHTGASHLVMQHMNAMAGRISPVAAYIADMSECASNLPECLIEKYANNFWWYLLWNWGLTSFSIDEAYSSGGVGVCAEQSTYMASILDLLRVDYYVMHLTGFNSKGREKDHRIIYVPEWNVTFSNNQMFKKYKEPNDYQGLIYVSHKNDWIFFDDSVVMGNVSFAKAKDLLEDFFDMSLREGFSRGYVCKPFSKGRNREGCDELKNRINSVEYKRIGFVQLTPADFQRLLVKG